MRFFANLRWKYLATAAGLWAGITLLDQLIKFLVVSNLKPYLDYPVIGNFFKLTLVYNKGILFGIRLFPSEMAWLYPTVMIGIMALVLSALIFEKTWPNTVAYGMILGGALGNLLDRFRIGRVVDFLNFGIGDARWPYFNLADSAIITGILIIIVFSFRKKEEEPEGE
ncbi:MAG: signal peptidase II [candidate division WOR-3 bacterium]